MHGDHCPLRTGGGLMPPSIQKKNTNKQVFMRAVTQLTEASSLGLEMSLLWTSCRANKPQVSTPQNPISEQPDSDRSKRHTMKLQGAFEHLLNCKEQCGSLDVLSNLGTWARQIHLWLMHMAASTHPVLRYLTSDSTRHSYILYQMEPQAWIQAGSHCAAQNILELTM